MLVQGPLQRRSDVFLEMLQAKVIELANVVEIFRSGEYRNDPKFTTALLSALTAAVRTQKTEQLEALRSCVVDSVLIDTVDDAMDSIIYGMLDRITPTHL